MLSLAKTPVTIVSAAASLVAPLAAGHKAGLVPAAWRGRGGAVGELDILWRASASANVTAARLFEWYLRAKIVADSTFTTTHAANTLTDNGHGLRTGTGPVRVSSDGTLPAGLTAGTDYWVIVVDANTLKLATSLANALQETAIDFTSDGSGTHTMHDVTGSENAEDDTREPTASEIAFLGNDPSAPGEFAVGVGLGASFTVKHRYEVVAYSVQATVSAGNHTVEMLPRGEV